MARYNRIQRLPPASASQLAQHRRLGRVAAFGRHAAGRSGAGQEAAVGFTGAVATELKVRPAVCGGLMLGLAHAVGRRGILAGMEGPNPQRRWYCPTPTWLVYASLLVTGILFLSERWRWFPFNAHKGWTVLVAVAGVGAVLMVMLLCFLVAARAGRGRGSAVQLAGGPD